ncbi:hypothetical protein DH2020_017238 [Rehmannia glutinosa]|uniref:Uncharacterized protein n=1 Tax=Rehmannia glutinosa TaxID=99300 RepID=A0ABR0WQ95_REHGL
MARELGSSTSGGVLRKLRGSDMDYPTQPKQPEKETKTSNPLKYTFDGRFSPTTPPDDETPQTTESTHSNSETGQSSGSGYYDPTRGSVCEPPAHRQHHAEDGARGTGNDEEKGKCSARIAEAASRIGR